MLPTQIPSIVEAEVLWAVYVKGAMMGSEITKTLGGSASTIGSCIIRLLTKGYMSRVETERAHPDYALTPKGAAFCVFLNTYKGK